MAVPMFNLAPNLAVSRLCYGTMTFGEQNSLSESFRLLDKAFDSGINFFDSAEMYPVPQRAETQGRSEEFLGRWIKDRGIPRGRLVLATKSLMLKLHHNEGLFRFPNLNFLYPMAKHRCGSPSEFVSARVLECQDLRRRSMTALLIGELPHVKGRNWTKQRRQQTRSRH